MNFITKAAQDFIRAFELNDTLTKFANWLRRDIFKGGDKQIVKANGDYYTFTTGVTPGSYTVVSLTVNEFGQITSISSGTAGGGTVTSVGLSAGTGISIGGTNPVTTSGTISVTNTSPDQTVVLNNGTGISVTGTYPNFTITNTSPSSGGTVTNVSGTTNRITSSGGTTPVIDISSVFESLLSKISQRIDENNSATTSAQLATVISDEVGTGSLVFQSYIDTKITDNNLAIYNALGSVVKGQSEPIQYINQNSNLADNVAYYQAIWLPVAQTLTGVKWYQRTIGSYTADNNNVIGLYTYSGGTLTQVAVTANDGNLWQTAGSNTIGSKAFSATYAASAGLYFIGILYNSSAAVTAPALGTIVNFTNLSQSALDFTNSAKLCSVISGQNNLPASQAMSGLTSNTLRFWLSLY